MPDSSRAGHRPGLRADRLRRRGLRQLRFAMLGLLAGASLLAGCGQRGPLYLPEQGPPKKRLSAQQVSEPSVPAKAGPVRTAQHPLDGIPSHAPSGHS